MSIPAIIYKYVQNDQICPKKKAFIAIEYFVKKCLYFDIPGDPSQTDTFALALMHNLAGHISNFPYYNKCSKRGP